MITKKIHVSQKHIAQGRRHDPWKCPVALAVREELNAPINLKVSVGLWHILKYDDINIVSGRWSSATAYTPRSVARFIKKYDKKEKVQPFNFILRMKPR